MITLDDIELHLEPHELTAWDCMNAMDDLELRCHLDVALIEIVRLRQQIAAMHLGDV